jgi:hypothetical protein
MASLLQAVRNAGANNVVSLGGLLAHNHLWQSKLTWDADTPIQDLNAKHAFGGDQKYTAHVDVAARCTKRLRHAALWAAATTRL